MSTLCAGFIASDSRMRVGFERDDDGGGAASAPGSTGRHFEHTSLAQEREHSWWGFVFSPSREGSPQPSGLSPDLTCIIGGSKTGKVRCWTAFGSRRCAAPGRTGRSVTTWKSGDGASSVPARRTQSSNAPEEPRARHFSNVAGAVLRQSELQHLSLEVSSVETILAGLVPLSARPLARPGVTRRESARHPRPGSGACVAASGRHRSRRPDAGGSGCPRSRYRPPAIGECRCPRAGWRARAGRR